MIHGHRGIGIEVSPGELLDRLSILRIKSERISDQAKLANVLHERNLLEDARRRSIPATNAIRGLEAKLRTVNETLWMSEDEVRALERDQDFGARFIHVARSIYQLNDRRAKLKREVNQLLRSSLVEEKSHGPPC